MELAMGAMGSLLPKLAGLLDKEYKLQKSVNKDFRYLQRELQSMHAALSAVADVPREQLQQHDRLWASDVRELSHDIEDVVDGILVHIDGPESDTAADQECIMVLMVKMVNLLKKSKARREIATAIKDIKDQVHEVANRDARYRGPLGAVANLTAATPVTTTVDPLLIALYGDQKNIIGIADAKNEILKKLSDGDHVSNQRLKILSIVGFGGLGKTTLTKAVYDELRVGGQFGRMAFVTVSRNPDVKKVIRDLLYELDNQRYKKLRGAVLLDERQLIGQLRKSLGTKRYLIVVDDLWDVKIWEKMSYGLVDSNNGSKIITTTRNLEVSNACCNWNTDLIHNMKPLSYANSQILFYKRIFGSETGCPQDLVQVSRDILKKCGGVPLAIITIASHLAGDHQIKPKDQWDTLLNSIGRGLTRGGDLEEMRRILSLSYYDLHYGLKNCLLYLSIFPEDSEISKDRLIRRWIGEGFLQGENNETRMFDLGESYFNMLINRGLIEPIDINVEGRARACRVHDMMLDLICDLSSEENFVTILDVIRGNTPLRRKVRMMSLQKSMENCTATRLASTSMSQVRSFTIFSSAASQMFSLSRFRVLRVLDLEGCRFSESRHLNLEHVGNLLYLRYLGLRGTCAHELPMEIKKLQFLQTLDLGKTCAQLPSSVVWLVNLLFLYVSPGIQLPAGLRNLTSLEELTGLSLGYYCADIVKELGHLINLRVLDICWGCSKSDEALVESLRNLRKLQSLEIRGTNEHVYLSRYWVPPPQLCRLVLRGWSRTLPKTWFGSSSLPLLSYLHMNVRQVRLEDIQILGKLPALRFVTLKATRNLATEQCDVERFVFSADAFPCARQCFFFNVTMVPSNFPRGSLPMVQSLRFNIRVSHIINGDFDLSMRNLPSLEQVYIDYDTFANLHQAHDILSRALEGHPNRPTFHSGSYCPTEKEREGTVFDGGLGQTSYTQSLLAGGNVVGSDSGNTIVQAPISSGVSDDSSIISSLSAGDNAVGIDSRNSIVEAPVSSAVSSDSSIISSLSAGDNAVGIDAGNSIAEAPISFVVSNESSIISSLSAGDNAVGIDSRNSIVEAPISSAVSNDSFIISSLSAGDNAVGIDARNSIAEAPISSVVSNESSIISSLSAGDNAVGIDSRNSIVEAPISSAVSNDSSIISSLSARDNAVGIDSGNSIAEAPISSAVSNESSIISSLSVGDNAVGIDSGNSIVEAPISSLVSNESCIISSLSAGDNAVGVDSGNSIVEAPISTVVSNESSIIRRPRTDVVATDDSIVQPSISPVSSNGFSCMFWSFLAEMNLEMKLIISTRIFWCFLIGSVLLYTFYSSDP